MASVDERLRHVVLKIKRAKKHSAELYRWPANHVVIQENKSWTLTIVRCWLLITTVCWSIGSPES